jgi:p-cumate 2,3-dioxygenase alpha subunit
MMMNRKLHGDLRKSISKLILDEEDRSSFRVHRSVFREQAILDLEREAIFGHCWLYAAHVSELPTANTFISRRVGTHELLLTRDQTGHIRSFFNVCSHRGAIICRERLGKRKRFQCPYHGWVYDNSGKNVAIPDRESMSPVQLEGGRLDLVSVAQIDQYAGFIFICFDPKTMPLRDYLGRAKDGLDIVTQYAGDEMEIVKGMQEYSIAANWKLLVENSNDGYHAPFAHTTYFDYINARDRVAGPSQYSASSSVTGYIHDLDNGHTMMAFEGRAWGRPYARWVPGWGEETKEEIAQIGRNLVERLGSERAHSVSQVDRAIAIFPNLAVNDMVSITVRTFYPVHTDSMHVTAWALAPKRESAASRDRRLRNFLEFLGPAGFATPDDIEILELCQRGYANMSGGNWNDISRGMHKTEPGLRDEHQTRAFWRQWKGLMTAQITLETAWN